MKLLAIFSFSVAVIASPIIEPSRSGLIQEEMRWQGWVPNGQVVEINNVHGNVRAEAADGDQIEVVAVKRGAGDPEQVSIQVVEHKGGITICAVYPNADPSRPFDCRPSHGGGYRVASDSGAETHIRWDNGGGGDVVLNDLRVDFIVRLPKRLRFIGRTMDGEVSAHLLEEDVEAHSVRGDVRVEMTDLRGVDVRAETADGEVRSEFPLALHYDNNHGLMASGRVGHSRRTLRLKTAMGDIHLDRIVPVL
jgi:hypothetical protein